MINYSATAATTQQIIGCNDGMIKDQWDAPIARASVNFDFIVRYYYPSDDKLCAIYPLL